VSGSPSYLILCDRSFGQYIFDTIVDAGTEFTISANA
jgi:sarcosine oxidase gamma subunit